MVAFVQKSAELFADAAASIAPSLAGVTAGNFVVMLVAVSLNSNNTSLQPPAGWLLAEAPLVPGAGTFRPTLGIFYKEKSAGGTESGTVTFVAGSYAAASIVEFSGIPRAVLGAHTNQTNTTGTSAVSGSVRNRGSNAVALVIGHPQVPAGGTSNLSSPAATGFTAIDTESTDAVHIAYDFSYKILDTPAEQEGSWTWTESASYSTAIAIFEDVPLSGGRMIIADDDEGRWNDLDIRAWW